jgi:hypothetical protein
MGGFSFSNMLSLEKLFLFFERANVWLGEIPPGRCL